MPKIQVYSTYQIIFSKQNQMLQNFTDPRDDLSFSFFSPFSNFGINLLSYFGLDFTGVTCQQNTTPVVKQTIITNDIYWHHRELTDAVTVCYHSIVNVWIGRCLVVTTIDTPFFLLSLSSSYSTSQHNLCQLLLC